MRILYSEDLPRIIYGKIKMNVFCAFSFHVKIFLIKYIYKYSSRYKIIV